MNDEHDEMLIEKYANNRGEARSDEYSNLARKIFTYFGFW